MKYLKHLPYIIEFWILDSICVAIHELSHYVITVYFWMCGACSFPKIQVTRWPKWELIEGGANNVYTMSAQVSYETIRGNPINQILDRLCAIAPAITVILFFILGPLWLQVFTISNIGTLWISSGDVNRAFGKYDK